YPLYDHLLQALIQIMTDHRARLGGETPRAAAPVTACPLFEHEETDLAAIAAYLTTPARSGLYLTRRDLQELAVKAELPRSFGESRATSLVTIIKTAARFERLPKLWSELIRWFDEAARRYQAVEPALRWAAEPWQQRAEAT